MSIQWTLVAGVLYAEILLVTLLLLPFLKPRTWQKFFKSRFLLSLESQANLYYMAFVVILVLLFLGKCQSDIMNLFLISSPLSTRQLIQIYTYITQTQYVR